MRHVWTAAVLTALLAGPLATAPASAKQRPITDSEPDAVDIAKTPATDLNLDKTKIPPLLQAATQEPYTLVGIKTCAQISSAVLALDDVLGPDADLPSDPGGSISTGRVAKWAVGSLIPFRGLIREISGANAQDRAVLAAIRAGIARRSFLKGVGHAKGCKYPASPATPAIVKAHLQSLEQDRKRDGKQEDRTTAADAKRDGSGASVPTTSTPVVQKVP